MAENKSRPFLGLALYRSLDRGTMHECVIREHVRLVLRFLPLLDFTGHGDGEKRQLCDPYLLHTGFFRGKTEDVTDLPTGKHSHTHTHGTATMMMVIYCELWDICLLSEKFDEYIKELGVS